MYARRGFRRVEHFQKRPPTGQKISPPPPPPYGEKVAKRPPHGKIIPLSDENVAKNFKGGLASTLADRPTPPPPPCGRTCIHVYIYFL